jgi:hypothetical protein
VGDVLNKGIFIMDKHDTNPGPFLVLALLILACGIAYASTNVAAGLREFRSYDRFVTVKGLATRDVVADLALWPIAYTETGNDLAALQNTMDERAKTIMAFLQQNSISADKTEMQQLNVQDLLAQSYRQEGAANSRYILTQTIMVRTNDVQAVAKAAQNLGDLVRQGVVLAQTGYNGPTYLFTKLNDIKPDMIAEATRNGRDAAAQFAKDSGQEVGEIRSANQGLFQILPRDESYTVPEPQQMNKTVRVVSTLDFYLE